MAGSTTWQRRTLGNWRRQIIPVAVWLVAVGAAGTLLIRRSVTGELTGIAVPEQRAIAALADGRLRLLPVELFESVKEGQTLAVLEDDRIQAALATAAAEAARLRSEFVAAESRLTAEAAAQEADYVAQARRFAIDVENLRLREVELHVTLEADRARVEFLRLQRDLFGNLREQAAVSELRFKSAEADLAALERTISANQDVLSDVQQDLAQASRRQEEYARHHALPAELDKALDPLRAAITVQQRRIDELSAEQSLLILKCPLDGKVSQLLRGVGESIRTGEPILMIASTRPSAVMVYAAPSQLLRLGDGATVRLDLSRDGRDSKSVAAHVQAVGPTIEQLPARLWRNPSIPEWGWPVRISIPPAMDVLCGEMISVSAQSGPERPDPQTPALGNRLQ